MTMTIEEILARWNTSEGKPYKRSLIDWGAYGKDGEEPPEDLGCMCAQGQALHLLGGWTPTMLRRADQAQADKATAEILNISLVHSVLLRWINDTTDGAPASVLADPERVLGDQANIILAFWVHLDKMTPDQWTAAWTADKEAAQAAQAAAAATREAAQAAAEAAVREAAAEAVVREAAGVAAVASVREAASRAAWGAAEAAARATHEIQGARITRERGQPFVFLPMFGFATPEDIPPLPEDYGMREIVG